MAVKKNAARWNGKNANVARAGPQKMKRTSGTTSNACRRTACSWPTMGAREKAITNVIRYTVNGTTHSRGTAARSIVTYVVSPNIRLEGTKASTTQLNRSPQRD